MSKVIAYLTIDDSPSKYFRKKVDFLYRNNINVVFFCIGNYLEKYPKDAVYAIKKGFIIANHSYSHKHFSLLSLESCKEEIRKTDNVINKIYKKAKVKRPVKLFRFPYGDRGVGRNFILNLFTFSYKFRSIEKYLKEMGYVNIQTNLKYYFLKGSDVFWTFDLREYKLNIKEVMKKIDYFNFKNEEIILVHDHARTHKNFEKIINKLISKGCNFKKLRY